MERNRSQKIEVNILINRPLHRRLWLTYNTPALNISVKEKLTRHPTTIVVVAAVLTLVSFSAVYFKIESMGASERATTHEIRKLENIRGQIIFYGEVLTSSTLMAAVTGNDSWGERFLEHQILLEEALVNMKKLLGNNGLVDFHTEDITDKLLGYEYEAFELIQQNRADEARHMLFGAAYQQQKILYEKALAKLGDQVDAYIEDTHREIEHVRLLTQQYILVTLLLILGGWVFVLLLIHWWQQEVRQLAFYDPLTGLASRRYFTLHIDKAIKSAKRRGIGFTLLFMDLDGFKDVNDSMGHDVGDHLLKVIGNRLSRSARDCDFVSRLGGDEFCILLEDLNENPDIEVVVERFIDAIEAPVDLSARQFRPRTSIGIARYPVDGANAQVLMKSADSAMYSAKRSGKHLYEYYNSNLTDQAEQRLSLIGDLREAFHRDEFCLYYQPVINLTSGHVIGVEALVRWEHPHRGLVPPSEFIPQLEEMGLIDKLGEWVLERACTQALDWTYLGQPLRIAVNISPQHFLKSDFVNYVNQVITSVGISPDRVILEITESTIQDTTKGNENFAQLHELGVRLAIDDFGTGYSSLGSLRTMPIDILKIDQVFIRDLLKEGRGSIMLSAIMGMANSLELQVVAEGVEEYGHVLALRSVGCELAQGYLFSKPICAADMILLLENELLFEAAIEIEDQRKSA